MPKFEVGDVVRFAVGSYWERLRPLGGFVVIGVNQGYSLKIRHIDWLPFPQPVFWEGDDERKTANFMQSQFQKDEFLTAVYRASGKINPQTKQQEGDHH